MRRIAGTIVFVFLAAGCAWAGAGGSIPAAQQPVVKEIKGSGGIVLTAAKYPNFAISNVESITDPACKHTGPGSVFAALAGNDIRTVSPTTGMAVSVNTSLLGRQPTDLKITLTGKEIPEAYRASAKILVTWTVRIEGYCPSYWLGHVICEPWIGTVAFNCPKGNVKTYLHATYAVNGKVTSGVIGQPVTMEMPAGSAGPVTQRDPTLTGTYMINASDFPGKQIPQNLELQIFWENFTSLQVYSPDGLRTMIVNVIPYSKQDK